MIYSINRVYNYENLAFMAGINDKSVDLIYSDILFGTGKKFKSYNDIKNDNQTMYSFYYQRFKEMYRILKPTGLLYIHCSFRSSQIQYYLNEIFGQDQLRNEIIWYYNSAPRRKKDFGERHERILRYSKTNNYFFNEESKYIRQPYAESAPRGYAKEKYYDSRGKILDDVWKIPMLGQNDKKERTGYSTQKPEALMFPIIDSSCPKDGLFFDPFMGSGTSIVVAHKLGINFIGCDSNPKAIEITEKRLRGLN